MNATRVLLGFATALLTSGCPRHREPAAPADAGTVVAASPPATSAPAKAAAADAGKPCLPPGAPPGSYCADQNVGLTGTLQKKTAFVSDGIFAHGKPEHRIYVLALDEPIHMADADGVVESKTVQVDAQLAKEKPPAEAALVGKRVVVTGAITRAERPHEVEPIVFSWMGDEPNVKSAP